VSDRGQATRLFLYGTLRRDAPMHALLGEGARFLGKARFQGRLWDFGAYPGVTDSPRAADVVHGELYALPDGDGDGEAADVLERLDRYEGDGFERAERTVRTADGETHRAQLYLVRVSTRGARRILSGDYVAELRTAGRAARRA
jgi:gamma-glutamylcyclotransferase (GGCT)/AIG2-like uncharacterized protein YtfP